MDVVYPATAAVPGKLRTADLLLRPLRPLHVDLDYDALMSSRERLRRTGDGDWPADDFTREENLADLVDHEREHQERFAFTFTVMNPDKTRCEGCVYINPWSRILKHVHPDDAATIVPGSYEAVVHFWVRDSALECDMDRQLIAGLRDWFAADWAFSRVHFLANDREEREARLLIEAGLRQQYVVRQRESDGMWYFYTDTADTRE